MLNDYIKRTKEKINKNKHPLYFIGRGFFYFTWTIAVLLLWLIIKAIVTFPRNKQFGGSLGMLWLLLSSVFILTVALYYLYKSRKISFKMLIVMMLVYFLIVPIIFALRISTLSLVTLLFVACSLIILAIYMCYAVSKYVVPGMIVRNSEEWKKKLKFKRKHNRE